MHSSAYSRNRFADMTRPFMTHLGFQLRQLGMANTSSQGFLSRSSDWRGGSAALFCLPPGGQSLAQRLFGSQHVGFSLIEGGTKKRVPLYPATEAPAAASVVWIIGPHFLRYAMKKPWLLVSPARALRITQTGQLDPNHSLCVRGFQKLTVLSATGRLLTVIAAAVIVVSMTIAVRRNSHGAFDATDNAAHYAADNGTDRTGIAITYSGAVLTALNYALCLRCGLHRQNGGSSQKSNSYDQVRFHGIPLFDRVLMDV